VAASRSSAKARRPETPFKDDLTRSRPTRSVTSLLVPVRIKWSFKLTVFVIHENRIPQKKFIRLGSLHKGLIIDNQLVVGKEQEHIGERYSLLGLVNDDRFVVKATEEPAAPPDILVVDRRQGSVQQPEVDTVGGGPGARLPLCRNPTRGQYLLDTELCRIDANFEDTTQFLCGEKSRHKTRSICLKGKKSSP